MALAYLAAAAPALGQSFETVLMPGKVIAGHAKWEEACAKCHVPFDKRAQARLCLDCHKPVAQDLHEGKGYHGREKERDCRTCHTDHKGREAKIVRLDEAKFDHAMTDFALRGAHLPLKCHACHAPRRAYREAPGGCNDCHVKDDRHKGTLGAKCAECHGEASWKEAKFDHDKTRYPLKGRHAQVACKECHAGERYQGAPQDCIACHRKDDTHKGLWGAKCGACHDERDWKRASFSHERDTRFPLREKHAGVKCESCHKAPAVREKTPATCYGCHRGDDVHQGTLGTKCESCHGERTWKKASFQHDARFALRGKHASAKCDACHRDNGRYTEKLPETCIGCHRLDDERAGHRGRYGEKCESCHTEKAWKPSTFRHEAATQYPLRGRHAQVKCDDCHGGALYRDKLRQACIACHEKDDKHRAQLGRQCESCHAEASWSKTAFDHNRSRFPLLGRHAPLECKACHASPLYRDAKTACVACHGKDDVHERRLGPRCEQCHNARDWKIWDFDHARTRYPLEGAHVRVACRACHSQPVKDTLRLAMDCASCHRRDDVHGGRFGNQCERCHVADAWPSLRPASLGNARASGTRQGR
jgi:hypothetical protein